MNEAHGGDDYFAPQVCTNGHVIDDGVVGLHEEPIMDEKFCYQCGAPVIKRCLHCATIIRLRYAVPQDTPQATVATSRFKRLVAKAGKEAVEGSRSLLVDIVSETVKKSMWPS